MTKHARPRLAILGGQGALASAAFHQRLVTAVTKLPGLRVEEDDDYPDILHLSAALPGLGNEGVVSPRLALQALRERVRLAEDWGARLVLFPCNSVHSLLGDLRQETDVSLLCPWDTAQATLRLASSMNPWLVLASASLRRELVETPGALEAAVRQRAVALPTAPEARVVDEVIALVVAGAVKDARAAFKTKLLPALCRERDEPMRLVLGCTELSVACRGVPHGWVRETLDPMDTLLDEALARIAAMSAKKNES